MSEAQKAQARTLRRRLLVIAAPFVVLLLALAGKLMTMESNNAQGLRHHASGDWFAAAAAFNRNYQLNLFDPWVAPFNAGTAHFQDGELATAEADFRKALGSVPDDRACMVVLNLVWTIEATGDELAASGDLTGAKERWALAGTELEQSGCGKRIPATPTPTPDESATPTGTPTPSTGAKGRTSTGPASSRATSGSGSPTSGETKSAEEQKADEERRAQETEERLDEKQQQKSSKTSTRSASSAPTTAEPKSSEQQQQAEASMSAKERKAQQERNERNDRTSEPSGRSSQDRPW